MGMEEQAALAELRRMIRQLSPERQDEFNFAYAGVLALMDDYGDLGNVAMQVYLLENCHE